MQQLIKTFSYHLLIVIAHETGCPPELPAWGRLAIAASLIWGQRTDWAVNTTLLPVHVRLALQMWPGLAFLSIKGTFLWCFLQAKPHFPVLQDDPQKVLGGGEEMLWWWQSHLALRGGKKIQNTLVGQLVRLTIRQNTAVLWPNSADVLFYFLFKFWRRKRVFLLTAGDLWS